MNPVHIHLIINHLPIVGSILGAFVLIYGYLTRSIPTQNAAYLLFFIAAAGGIIAYFTGEPAEEAIEHLLGISKELIEVHEESAKAAFASTIAMAITSLVGIWVNLKWRSVQRTLSLINIFLALISFSLLAYTGYEGGKIRHTELNNGGQSDQIRNNEDD